MGVRECNSPSWDHRVVNGKPKTKDLIALNWKRLDTEIPISKYRNIAATKLEEHDVYNSTKRVDSQG